MMFAKSHLVDRQRLLEETKRCVIFFLRSHRLVQSVQTTMMMLVFAKSMVMMLVCKSMRLMMMLVFAKSMEQCRTVRAWTK